MFVNAVVMYLSPDCSFSACSCTRSDNRLVTNDWTKYSAGMVHRMTKVKFHE